MSIQAQVINILEELQDKYSFTYLFISHDLSMVRHISHQVGVMYLGNLIEYAQVDELYENMLHPYTSCLMSAVPIADPEQNRRSHRIILQGDVPSPIGSAIRLSVSHQMQPVQGNLQGEKAGTEKNQ